MHNFLIPDIDGVGISEKKTSLQFIIGNFFAFLYWFGSCEVSTVEEEDLLLCEEDYLPIFASKLMQDSCDFLNF